MDKAELYSMYEAIEGYKKELDQIANKMDSVDYEEYKSIISNLDDVVNSLQKVEREIYSKIRNKGR